MKYLGSEILPTCKLCKEVVDAVHPDSKLCQQCMVLEQIRKLESDDHDDRSLRWERKKQKRM
jgi:hypothetical protein